MYSKFALTIGAIAMLTLAGCADTSNSTSTPSTGSTATTSSSGASNVKSAKSATPAPAPAPVARKPIPEDGTVAEFDKQGTQLSDDAKANIASLANAASQAHHVEVTGYCARQDDERNAKQLALTRAAEVRNELIKLGVPAKNIRTKYVTTEPRHAVTVVLGK